MRRTITIMVAAALLAVAAHPAQAITQSVEIGDNFFTPSTQTANRGDKVMWINNGFSGHTSTGNAPLNFWASPTLGRKDSYTTPTALTAAGTYPYRCTIHFGMTGKVRVPLTLSKNLRKITLTLASAPSGATHKFVVQRKVGTSFATIATVTTTTFVFDAPSAGTYTFRTALQKNGTTAPAAFFSAAKSISVT